jgi:hypothetical protein
MNLIVKKLISITILVLLFSQLSSAQKDNCERETNFGEAEICLPKIDGYQECYLFPAVKQLADETELQSNSILGFYLNDETHDRRDSLRFFKFDDYWKVYAVNQMKDYTVDRKALVEMKSVLASNFIFKNWEDLAGEEIDKLGLDVEIGVPIVINSYSLNEESVSYIMLVEYEMEGNDSFTIAMALNLMVINERLIWMAYYLEYAGEETIPMLEKSSNLIVGKILDGNK